MTKNNIFRIVEDLRNIILVRTTPDGIISRRHQECGARRPILEGGNRTSEVDVLCKWVK